MPRAKRIVPPHAVLHVINRGNDRRTLFHTAADYEEFLGLMRYANAHVPLRVIAYVLMPNHWHFIVWPEGGTQLSRHLHRLCAAHAARWRWRAARVGEGHVYQDRYHAFVIESERQYFNSIRYVEANPLRAGLVSRAVEWRWSSLFERQSRSRHLLSEGPLPLPLDWPDIVDRAVAPSVLADLRERGRRTQRAAYVRARGKLRRRGTV